MNRLDNKLFKNDGSIAGLKDVMLWFIETYPGDIYVSPHPIHNFRDYCVANKDKLTEDNK